MHNDHNKYQNLLAQGWNGMLFLLLTMFITDIVELTIQGNFQHASDFMAKDPGTRGLWLLACLICFNVLVQMTVRSVNSTACRRFIFWATTLYTLFFAGHQVRHLLAGEGWDIHFVLDTTHNIVGAWASWAAYKWAQSTTTLIK